MNNPNFIWTWAHPIKLKPRQISVSNYSLLEALTWNSRKSLYANMNKLWLNPADYDDVAAFILNYTEKKFWSEFRKKKLADIIF